MQTSWLVWCLALLLAGCTSSLSPSALPPLPAARGPMIDDEPEGEVPSLHRLHERVFEPHWL